MNNYEAAAGIEGPYWDYVQASRYAEREANQWARITARYVVDGDIATAERRAVNFQAAEERCDRITARYDATKGTDVEWIGWDHR